jgi:hypothetical protein
MCSNGTLVSATRSDSTQVNADVNATLLVRVRAPKRVDSMDEPVISIQYASPRLCVQYNAVSGHVGDSFRLSVSQF